MHNDVKYHLGETFFPASLKGKIPLLTPADVDKALVVARSEVRSFATQDFKYTANHMNHLSHLRARVEGLKNLQAKFVSPQLSLWEVLG